MEKNKDKVRELVWNRISGTGVSGIDASALAHALFQFDKADPSTVLGVFSDMEREGRIRCEGDNVVAVQAPAVSKAPPGASKWSSLARTHDEPVLEFFAYEQLSAELQLISEPFGSLVETVILGLPKSLERTKSLDRLLAAKDAAVRCAVAKRSRSKRVESMKTGR